MKRVIQKEVCEYLCDVCGEVIHIPIGEDTWKDDEGMWTLTHMNGEVTHYHNDCYEKMGEKKDEDEQSEAEALGIELSVGHRYSIASRGYRCVHRQDGDV